MQQLTAHRFLGLALAACLILASGRPAGAQDGKAAFGINPPANGTGYPPCALPADLEDPAFDRHADLLLLGVAWDNQDASLMADVGLQLAEAERILLRPHKAIKSAHVLQLAAHLAGDRKDKATLVRLAKVAEKSGDVPFKDLVALEMKEAESPDRHHLADALEDISPAALEVHKAAIRRIRAARYAGNHEGLAKLDAYFDGQAYLHKAQQEHIDKEVAEAKAKMPKQPVLHDLVVILDRLAAITPCKD